MTIGKRKSWIEQSRLTLESLETRSLLSGIHGAATARVPDHHPAIVSTAAAKSTAVAAKSSSVKSETHLVANLADATGASKVTGTAKFESELKRGVPVRELSVEVKGATAGSVIQVTATDAKGTASVLGSITVKADGSGKLKLTAKSPDILAGSSISLNSTDAAGTVSTLASGIFAVPTKGSGSGHDSSDHTETKLAAKLVDPASKLTGSVCFESETEHGLVVSELSVQLKGGTPGAVIDVSISLDGKSPASSIGQITIGADGTGKLKLNKTAPAVTATSVITLSTVSTATDGSVTVTPITNATFATVPKPGR
ncbi:hypothetical protein ETAA8_17210 [Anatilimnocola aggregata]|uniref:Uncharacterized protein n=1 Tax=Anatilimnocola aggregata TaxID=2528021 RepID=A0A517Y8T1_9BACT|nr:hypothetical protein [Anatilimnocola aggregata]QDU26640.1 hypothetical protein ETAA8_17210 [Anatilimnocola aggregata]